MRFFMPGGRMPNAEKLEKVAALKERIEESSAILLAEYRGLSVHDATELRRSLADQARFAVVKNTLMKRAADEAGLAGLEQLLLGPTAVAFVKGDVVAAAKRVADAAKRFPALVLKGAWMDGRMLSAEEARSLADLESRDVMLSKVAGMLKAEMSRAASMLQALQSRFLGLLDSYKEKLPAAEAAPEGPEGSWAPQEAPMSREDTETEPEGPEGDASTDEALDATKEGEE